MNAVECIEPFGSIETEPEVIEEKVLISQMSIPQTEAIVFMPLTSADT